ncbi:ribokinase [Stenotrophomonas sp. Leaf70]|uniref:ribokinase n=1 Tax=Stenotrophomonas sp. Leaf70 TaxID=1736233 RepID=UPI0006F8E8C8|nr:ribokinase [Stenotrophomonas sp. Leaf70]KQO00532.1 ribokinase [Stenotrophomonas sp. Leaf70]
MSCTVLVAGSANLDFVVRAAHVPAPGETVLGREFRTFPGGKGANQAVACARAGGADTRMLLALGNDDFARPIEASLLAAGVQLHTVRDAQLPTGTAFVCLSDDAENAITVAPGANLALQPGHLPALDGAQWLLLQLETPLDTVLAYARAARAAGVKVALNAAPAQALPDALLAQLDMLIVNEGELAVVAGDPPDLATGLARLDVPCVIVTLGARGCLAREAGRTLLQPAFSIAPVDTTAAGDTFCGTLVAALARGQALQQALLAASAASALACTRLGAQSSIPDAAEVAALLADATRVPGADAHAALAAWCTL